MSASSNKKKDCPHLNFNAKVDVNRLIADDKDKIPIAYATDISISCAECGVKMKFIGLSMGVSNAMPTTDVTGTELRAPIIPDINKIAIN